MFPRGAGLRPLPGSSERLLRAAAVQARIAGQTFDGFLICAPATGRWGRPTPVIPTVDLNQHRNLHLNPPPSPQVPADPPPTPSTSHPPHTLGVMSRCLQAKPRAAASAQESHTANITGRTEWKVFWSRNNVMIWCLCASCFIWIGQTPIRFIHFLLAVFVFPTFLASLCPGLSSLVLYRKTPCISLSDHCDLFNVASGFQFVFSVLVISKDIYGCISNIIILLCLPFVLKKNTPRRQLCVYSLLILSFAITAFLFCKAAVVCTLGPTSSSPPILNNNWQHWSGDAYFTNLSFHSTSLYQTNTYKSFKNWPDNQPEHLKKLHFDSVQENSWLQTADVQKRFALKSSDTTCLIDVKCNFSTWRVAFTNED